MPDWVLEISREYGAAAAVTLASIYAVHRGWLRIGREVERERELLAAIVADYEHRVRDLAIERDSWRAAALTAIDAGGRVIAAFESRELKK